MKSELIVFDLAGTTLKDNEEVIAASFKEAIRENGYHISDENINWVMGYKKRDAIVKLLESTGQKASEDEINTIHESFLTSLNAYYQSADISEIDGISDLFKSLAEHNIKIAINTGFNRSTFDILLNKLGWLEDGLVDDTIASDEVAHGRPQTDMIDTLCQRHNISNRSLIAKVGDTPSDLEEGENAGCGKVIGVLYGTHSKKELSSYYHDHLVSSVSELSDILLNSIHNV